MTSAAQRMDRIYRLQRHFYDFTRRPYLLGRIRLIENLRPAAGGRILEIGCGTAWNLIRAARTYPDVELYGFDVSSAMLQTAGDNILASDLEARINLSNGDATTFDAGVLFGVASFDRVVMSYTLSMIPDWPQVIAQAFEHVAPGGEIHIVDFGDFAGLPAIARAGLRAWLARFDVTPRLTLEAELHLLNSSRGWQVEVARPYRGYSQYAVIKRP
mgnify:CR=1 FL=1